MMKNFYFPFLCLLILSSCRPRLITRNITDKTSNYVVTTSGQKVNSASVSIHEERVFVDTTAYALKDISAVKIGTAYYGVKNGQFYDGVYYGKLILLRRYRGYTYDMGTHTSTPNYSYYIQKEGQPGILDLTGKNLVESVQDNPLALRKAQAARIYHTVAVVSTVTFISGLACVFLPYSNPIRKPAVTMGLISLPTWIITVPIATHKRYKTIVVYDR
jgi:hypothetical protein